MRKETRYSWKNSIEAKLMICFGIVITAIMVASFVIYQRAVILSRQLTYEKMNSQAQNYLQTLDQEIIHIRQLQRDFFNDRKLVFLVGPEMNISDYEKRDALLSVRERVNTVTGVSRLVQEGILYLPKSGYRITSSGVGMMEDEDRDVVKDYINDLDGRIHYDGDVFYTVEAGVPKVSYNSKPNHLLVIRISTEQLKSRLEALDITDGSGIFLYFPDEGVLVDPGPDNHVSMEIMDSLIKDAEGNYLDTQRIKVDGEHYLVFVGGQGALGFLVEYRKESSIMEPIARFRNLVYFLFVLMILMAVLFGIYSGKLIHDPIDILLKAFRRIQAGDWTEHILHTRQDEFSYLYDGFNQMEDQMREMIEQVYVQTNLAQRAQLKQLQAQIAPHFLFNSFFSLSSKIKRGDYDNAQELAAHLGAYFQYLTKNESDYVTLKQEVEHAGSYAAIQGTRFISRIAVSFEELPEHFEKITVPRLILQPLLENAFEYGLENKMRGGRLWVHYGEADGRYQIFVEDNGDTPDEKLRAIADILQATGNREYSGIANIHRRLQIFYHDRAGLRIRRSGIGGVCVEVYIDREEALGESKYTDC